ncbi:MAG: hypothetical protein HZC55_25920 [Verrucomicrobia bacterium]|nr:hypothetical protein [Verrucomicrobiota bacterium]
MPDPVLLDGSTHATEKKSEYGMIGDFELPGDENAKSGKVGGGKSGSDESQQNDAQGGGGGLPGAAKQGAGGGSAGSQAKAAGGQDQNAPDKPGGGGGEPGAKAEGIKVAELGGDPSGGAGDDPSKKPSPVAIGDKAMRIPQSTPSTAGVVGAQQVANQNTQVYEKATGTGGKAPTGTQGPNRTEKGRTIPPGL